MNFELRRLYLIPVMLLNIHLVNGQSFDAQDSIKSNYVTGVTVHTGHIMRHTVNFVPEVTEPSYMAELMVGKVRNGYKDWHHKLNYPEVGVSMLLAAFGDADIFGHAIGVFPHITLYPGAYKKWGYLFRIGAGAAYLTNPYHPVDNPTNNAISTNLNSLIQFRSGIWAQLNNQTKISLLGSLTHFSNGKYKSPNLGINIPSLGLSLTHRTGHLKETESITVSPYRKNHFFYRFGFGIHDTGISGPRHPVFTHTLSYARQTSQINRVWLGSTWAFDRAKYRYLIFDEWFEPPIPRKYASDWSVFLGDELLLGNASIFLLAGYYLYQPTFQAAPYYLKFGFHYYFWNFNHDRALFLYTNIKSHFVTADYFEFGIGFKL